MNGSGGTTNILIYKIKILIMVISSYVEMTLGLKTCKKIIKRYNLTESLKPGDIVKIPIDILSKSSHYEIEITCDYCDKKIKVPYKRYNLSTSVIKKYACSSKDCSNQKIKDVCQAKYGVDNPFQADFVKKKTKETLVEKYGVEHQMYMEETKYKIKETCLERYGVTSYTKTEDFKKKSVETNLEKYGFDYSCKTKEGKEKRKQTRIKKGTQIPDNLVSEYRKYRLIVNRNLQRNKNDILENWGGFDYYDGEFIKNNFKLNKNDRFYPHFDHKISVAYGFKNNIDPEIISDIKNICITKQYLNGLKKEMNEDEFKSLLKEKREN
jgi:hypothetical protein